jgi:hypothetical protein
MCGSDTNYEQRRRQENEQRLAQQREHEREIEQGIERARVARAKRARAAKRVATILKAKRVKAAKKGVATRRRNFALKKAKSFLPKHQTLTVFLKPETVAPKTSVIPRRKTVTAKARPLRSN